MIYLHTWRHEYIVAMSTNYNRLLDSNDSIDKTTSLLQRLINEIVGISRKIDILRVILMKLRMNITYVLVQ